MSSNWLLELHGVFFFLIKGALGFTPFNLLKQMFMHAFFVCLLALIFLLLDVVLQIGNEVLP